MTRRSVLSPPGWLAALLLLASCGADGAPERPGPDPRPDPGIDVSVSVGIGVGGSF